MFSDSDEGQDYGQAGDGMEPGGDVGRRSYFPRRLPPLDSRRGRGMTLTGGPFDGSGGQGADAGGRYRSTIGGGGTRGGT